MDILSYMIGKQSGGGITPTGKLDITNTNEVDVSAYATVQVVDADLVAENIKKDVDILGVVGTYEGGGDVEIVTWADGTDEQIKAMLDAHYEGKINIHDYWAVGDERTVSLSAIPSSGTANGVTWSVGESQEAQNVTMVLMQEGLYELVDGTECAFVVGQKNCLKNKGYLQSSGFPDSWDDSDRSKWCNGGYWNAMPDAIKPIFKQFKTTTAEKYDKATTKVSNNYFALFAEKEVFGSRSYSTIAEANALTQIEYFKTEANRIKQGYDNGNWVNANWWERSPDDSVRYCNVNNSGNADEQIIYAESCLAPFGCI